MKKRFLKAAIIAAIIVVCGYFAPSIGWRISGTLRGEAFYEDMPTSYWRQQLNADFERDEARIRRSLRGPSLTWGDRFNDWFDRLLQGHESRTGGLKRDAEGLPVLFELLRGDGERVPNIAFSWIQCHPHVTKEDMPELVEFVMSDRFCDAMYPDGNDSLVLIGLHQKFRSDILPHVYHWLDHPDKKQVARAVMTVSLCGEDGAPAIPSLIKRLDDENDCGGVGGAR